MLKRLCVLVFLLHISVTGQNILVGEDAQKSVLVPASDIGDDWWQDVNYNDSGWVTSSGLPGGVGYELSTGYEDFISLDVANEMSSSAASPNNSCYIRIPFSVAEEDIAGQSFLQLNIRHDDGFVAYLNGQKVAQANAPDVLNWNSAALSDEGEAGVPVQIILDTNINDLVIGQNILAIHGLNYTTSSSDFLITAELQAASQLGSFESSNLPIIVIDTQGGEIVHEPKIMATMGVINNGAGNRNSISDPFNAYEGWIGIEYRGNASFRVSDKKPFTIETRNEDGSNNNVELLGLPRENDFVLRAVYIDKTLMRDALAYYMSRSMGRWAPRTRHVEVILNGSYEGVYVLEEKIKPDDDRLDIAQLDSTDNEGEALTGGYIWCLNRRWGEEEHNDLLFDENETDGNPRFLRYPKPSDVTTQQFAYISALEQEFCDIMAGPNYNHPISGYKNYIDVSSFIDEIILQEITSNSDAYTYSSYFYKERGGKIFAGPVWDFDQGLCNSTHNDGGRIDEWIITKPSGDRPLYWDRLFAEPEFQTQLNAIWNAYRKDVLSKERIVAFIDSMTNYLYEAQERNFTRWPILGEYIWRSLPGADERDTHQKEVDFMKEWLLAHIDWMDEQLEPEVTALNDDMANAVQSFDLKQNYPNPFNPETVIDYSVWANLDSPIRVELSVYNLLGEKVATLVNQKQNPGKYSVTFNAASLPSGIYLYRIQAGKHSATHKMVLLK